jgi:hypothetical protein
MDPGEEGGRSVTIDLRTDLPHPARVYDRPPGLKLVAKVASVSWGVQNRLICAPRFARTVVERPHMPN